MFKIVQYVLWRLPCNFFPMQHHFIQAQTFLPCKISFVYHIIKRLLGEDWCLLHSKGATTWRSFFSVHLCSYQLVFPNIKEEIPRDANCSAP